MPRNHHLDTIPSFSSRYSLGLVAVTMLLLAYSILFKMLPILIFLMIWFAHIAYHPRAVFTPKWRDMIVLFLPLLALSSALWSPFPAGTAYAGLEYIAMVFCAIICARFIEMKGFLLGLSAGGMAVVWIAILSGQYTIDYISGERSLVGYFGSKNITGLLSEITIIAAIFVFLMRGVSWWEKIVLGIIPCGLGFTGLWLSHSVSSGLSLCVALLVMGCIWAFVRCPREMRQFLLIFMALFGVTASLFAAGLMPEGYGALFEILGKNPNLTGRTYLWAEGIKIVRENPIFGHGYQAFWQPGVAAAEQYWKEFGIDNKRGFHFHNIFIQTGVDLGIVGVVAVIGLLLFGWVRGIHAAITNDKNIEYIAIAVFMAMFTTRAFVEVDWLGPFGAATFIFFYLLSCAYKRL